MPQFTECVGKTPYSSLLATLIVIIGTCVFCGTSFRALQIIIIGVLNDLFGFSVNWLEILQTMFVIIGVVMGVLAIILLVFGILATGPTRNSIYRGAKCIMGGRITAAFFIVLSYILTIAWLALLAVYMVSLLVYAQLDSICAKEIYSKTAKEIQDLNYCFNITRFGIYNIEMGSDYICGHTQLRSLCNKVTEAGPLFCVAFGAVVIIIIGMIHFLVTLGANYTRIKISKELTEYRDAIDTEDLALHSAAQNKVPVPYSSGVSNV